MKANVDVVAGDLGLMVKSIEMKDIDIPVAMQKAMAKEAQAMRERRARIIKADGEYQASLKLKAAAEEIESNPIALELRRIQMVTEVSSDPVSYTHLGMSGHRLCSTPTNPEPVSCGIPVTRWRTPYLRTCPAVISAESS